MKNGPVKTDLINDFKKQPYSGPPQLKFAVKNNWKFLCSRYPSSRSSTVKSYAVTSNLYPETTIKDAVNRSGTIPSRSTLHSLRNINLDNVISVGRNSNMTSRDSRDHSRPSLFSRNNQEPDLTSFKTLEDDDYGFKSRFSSSQV